MDASRRSFFGALAALLTTPIALRRVSKADSEIIEYETLAPSSPSKPGSSVFAFAAWIRTKPLSLDKSFGDFTSLSRVAPGQYRLEWGRPIGTRLLSVMVDEASGLVSNLKDAGDSGVTICVYDLTSGGDYRAAEPDDLRVLVLFV